MDSFIFPFVFFEEQSETDNLKAKNKFKPRENRLFLIAYVINQDRDEELPSNALSLLLYRA